MILSPRIGQCVQVWYRPVLRDGMPFHGRVGIVRIRSRGRRHERRNHGIEIDGQIIAVPCGNLRKATA